MTTVHIGNATLILADCTAVLPSIGAVDCAVFVTRPIFSMHLAAVCYAAIVAIWMTSWMPA